MSTHTRPRLRTHESLSSRRGPVPAWYDGVAALLAGAAVYGLTLEGAYRVSDGVRANFPDVMHGQDMVTALTIPVFLWLTYRARHGSRLAARSRAPDLKCACSWCECRARGCAL